MGLSASISKQILKFKKPATTSRGAFEDRTIWILKIWNSQTPEIYGLGECAPLKGLSIDDQSDYENKLETLVKNINLGKNINKFNFKEFPSIKFGIETALLDLKNGGKRIIYKNFYAIGKQGIAINGLIWMNQFNEMKKEAIEKLELGFDCLKFKIGAIDFEKECELLSMVRNHPLGKNIIIRLDANGAFKPNEALDKINILSHFNIHSIEQPIKKGQWQAMKELCQTSPIPIALDEELIGIFDEKDIEQMLIEIQPQYIVLKPNLLGGFVQSDLWIKQAEKHNIGWWLTSALEGNIGLNAIAQYAASKVTKHHSGLGTGKLYTNNLPPYTRMDNGFLWRDMGYVKSDNINPYSNNE
jgi:o-succinylbenzoate synthase